MTNLAASFFLLLSIIPPWEDSNFNSKKLANPIVFARFLEFKLKLEVWRLILEIFGALLHCERLNIFSLRALDTLLSVSSLLEILLSF